MHNLSLASPRYRQSNLSPDIKNKKGCWCWHALPRGSQTQTCTSHQNENQNHCIHLIIGPSLLFAASAASPFPHQGIYERRRDLILATTSSVNKGLVFILSPYSSCPFITRVILLLASSLTDPHIFVSRKKTYLCWKKHIRAHLRKNHAAETDRNA